MPAGSPSRLRTGRRYEKETADPRQNRPGAESALGAAALVMTARENPQGPRRNARRSTLGYKERPILTHARGRMGHGPALARDDNRGKIPSLCGFFLARKLRLHWGAKAG